MKNKSFWLVYLLMIIAQVILCNFTPACPYVMITILPVLILMIPISCSTHLALLIAFLTGLATDILADGIIGLNILALVPVALCRKGVISLFFGEEIFARNTNISFSRNGMVKMVSAIITVQSLFLVIYIWADLAGTRSFIFCLLRFVASLTTSVLIGLLVANCLTKEPDRRWR